MLEDGPASGELQGATLVETEAGTIPANVDVIIRIARQRIHPQHDLGQYLILHTNPGEEIRVTVIRGWELVTETITL